MIKLVWCLMCVSVLTHASDKEPLRFWKDNKGREIVGELLASDGVRVTLRVEDNSKKVLPLSLLSEADRKFISIWRSEYPEAAWIDPEAMPNWPEAVGKGVCEVKKMLVTGSDGSGAGYKWRSRHFEIRSDMELPLSVVQDMATVFEATRIAVQQLPLGLAAQPPVTSMQLHLERSNPQLKYDPNLLRVQFYGDKKNYANSGALVGSGGFYNTMQNRTVLSLENLGIKGEKGLYRSDYMKSAFVLKHEVTHHLLHDWLPYLPIWFQEGFAEYMGAASYNQGRYKFNSMDQHLHKYLNRWRFNEDPNRIPVMKMEELMNSTSEGWKARLKRSTPILEYNSAAILVHFFIHHDGKGDASHLAAYLDAIRRGISTSESEKKHLLRGRSYEQIDEEIHQVWGKNKVSLERAGEVDPFK